MEYGLIGEHLSHSLSVAVHGMLGSYDYRLQELSPQEVESFMKRKDFKGINVTIPYKRTVISYLDEIDRNAELIGAVNTVVNRKGKLTGYNTDHSGMKAMIEKNGISISGKTVLILGSGGTSHTARAVCQGLGAKMIQVVSRSPSDGAVSYETAYKELSDADVIINTTPVGMYPKYDGVPIDISKFPRLSGVIDAIYNPLNSELVLNARERGIKACGGLYMLVMQAVFASELFTENTISKKTAESAYIRVLRQTENIFLIGMPGCGKTTVGELLGEKTGRRFFDSDEIIKRSANAEITEIFKAEGEAGFRKRETQAIRELCRNTRGAVIATGGGAVLNGENVRAMRSCGRIYFLDRDINDILPTSDRPLSSDCEALSRRYNERYPIYMRSADVRVEVSTDAVGCAEYIMEDFCG